ncbi:MAG: hypothetical protein ACRC1H_00315, partial [Caldilineaceae bacterium]
LHPMSNPRPTPKPKSSSGGSSQSTGSKRSPAKEATPTRVKPATPARPPTVASRKLAPAEPVMTSWLEDAGYFLARYWQELAAIAAIVVGAIMLMTIYSTAEVYPGVPVVSWAERVFGWTAPWVAVVLVLAGVVSLMGNRAGYWSVEALVGAELLLLSLQVGSSVRAMEGPNWSPPTDGSGGGVVGWALGTLLVAGFGTTLTMVIVWGAAIAGVLLLVRYTPLIYALAAVVAGANALRRRFMQPPALMPTDEGWVTARAPRHAAVKFVPPQPENLAGELLPGTPALVRPAQAGEFGTLPAAQLDAGSLPPFLRRKPGAGNGVSTPEVSLPADVPPVTAATPAGDAAARKARGKGAPHAVAPALSALP